MPPVNPRVSTVVSDDEHADLVEIADRLHVSVSWVLRALVRDLLKRTPKMSDQQLAAHLTTKK